MTQHLSSLKLVRGSEMQDFLRCRLRWKYAWADHLEPKTLNDKLFFGNLFHRWVEAWYASDRNKTDADVAMNLYYQNSDTTGMDQVALNELWTLACGVTDHYHRTYQERDASIRLCAPEVTFAIPISNKTGYTGTIDLIYVDGDGRLRFKDHKTTISLDKYEKNAVMDRQISRYWWAVQQLQAGKGFVKVGEEWVQITQTVFYHTVLKDREIGSFIYNVVLKDVPVGPKVLTKGNLSKDKSQKTTYELYRQALLQAGLATETLEGQLDAPGYEDFLSYLLESPKEFFRRVEVHRNQDEIDASIKEFFYTVKEMNRVDPANPENTYRNITSDCSWDCAFRDVCIAGFDGSNIDLLLNTLYKQGDHR